MIAEELTDLRQDVVDPLHLSEGRHMLDAKP